jgi:hypothetical protein
VSSRTGIISPEAWLTRGAARLDGELATWQVGGTGGAAKDWTLPLTYTTDEKPAEQLQRRVEAMVAQGACESALLLVRGQVPLAFPYMARAACLRAPFLTAPISIFGKGCAPAPPSGVCDAVLPLVAGR